MFSYFGSKRRHLYFYPPPKLSKIIEPFAGGASYAFAYFDREVWINDISVDIFHVWKYLKQASRHDILSLPDVNCGDNLRSYHLSQTERNLIGLAANNASMSPNTKISSWGMSGRSSELWSVRKRWIADNLWRIRHWRISNLDYKCIPNQEATWFVDPHYQTKGYRYPHHDINFPYLANWCRKRLGQVIVCENDEATWLPFRFLRQVHGINGLITECIWTKN